jgi:hypothetical protein
VTWGGGEGDRIDFRGRFSGESEKEGEEEEEKRERKKGM